VGERKKMNNALFRGGVGSHLEGIYAATAKVAVITTTAPDPGPTCFLLGQAHRRRIGDDLGLAVRSATTQDSYPSQLICDHGIPRAAAASVGGRGGGLATALRRPLPSPPPQHPPTATFSSRLASCRWHQIPAAIHGETLGLRTGWGLTSLPRQSDLLLAGVTPEIVTAYKLPCR